MNSVSAEISITLTQDVAPLEKEQGCVKGD